MTSLVSIIIPTFNRLDMLHEAVASCLRQTYRNIEVIVVDDGSTDGTQELFESRMPAAWAGRVSYRRQANGGASTARNEGLRMASGRYVQFLDSDDILLEEKLALQVALMESGSASAEACSCFGRLVGNVDGKDVSQRIGVQCATPNEYIRKLCGAVVHGMQTSAPIWRRDLLLAQAGWNAGISLGDDFEYYVRLLANVRRVQFVDRELFLVREHGGPRLSDSAGDRRRVMSAFAAHQSVVNSVREAGLLDSTVERGLARKGRSLYGNLLTYGTAADVGEFEEWFRRRWRGRRGGKVLSVAISCRRLLGQRSTSAIIDRMLRAKRWLR